MKICTTERSPSPGLTLLSGRDERNGVDQGFLSNQILKPKTSNLPSASPPDSDNSSRASASKQQAPSVTCCGFKIFQQNDRLTFKVFLLVGTVSLIGWNAFLNTLTAVLKVIYDDQGSFTDTISATYFTTVCLVAITATRIHIAQGWILCMGLASMGILSLTLAVICTYTPVSSFLSLSVLRRGS